MLTCPAKPGFFSDRALKNRRGINKGSKIQRNTVLLNSFPEFLNGYAEAYGNHAPGVPANVTQRGIFSVRAKAALAGR